MSKQSVIDQIQAISKSSAQAIYWVPSQLDYSAIEMRLMSYFEEMRDFSFLRPGTLVQVGEKSDGRVFEVLWMANKSVVCKNASSGVQTSYSGTDLWPVLPLEALARMSA